MTFDAAIVGGAEESIACSCLLCEFTEVAGAKDGQVYGEVS